MQWTFHYYLSRSRTCSCISLPYFVFGWALSWGSAFAVCIVRCSMVYQFEHSGKVRWVWFEFLSENFYSSLLSDSASFLCAALMSPQRTKQCCLQIEYIYIYIFNTGVTHTLTFQTCSTTYTCQEELCMMGEGLLVIIRSSHAGHTSLRMRPATHARTHTHTHARTHARTHAHTHAHLNSDLYGFQQGVLESKHGNLQLPSIQYNFAVM